MRAISIVQPPGSNPKTQAKRILLETFYSGSHLVSSPISLVRPLNFDSFCWLTVRELRDLFARTVESQMASDPVRWFKENSKEVELNVFRFAVMNTVLEEMV